MALKCKLGIHEYVPVEAVKRVYGDLASMALRENIEPGDEYEYVYGILKKKINNKEIIRDDVCLVCGKVRCNIGEEYNKLVKTVLKINFSF